MSDIIFNPIFIPFSFKIHTSQGTGFSESRFFMVQIFQGPEGPGLSGLSFFWVQVQGPSSDFKMDPGFPGSEFKSRSRFWVQVSEVAPVKCKKQVWKLIYTQ